MESYFLEAIFILFPRQLLAEMRIILVTPSLSGCGGIEGLSSSVLDSLTQAGHTVILISLPSIKSFFFFRLLSVAIFYLKIYLHSFFCTHILSMHPSLLKFVPDLLFRRLISICWVHGIDVWGALPVNTIMSLRSYQLLICSSRFTLSKMNEAYSFLRESRTAVLNPSIVKPIFIPLKNSSATNPRCLHLLTVSRLSSDHQYKGHDQIIAALSLLKDIEWRWSVVGTGDDLMRLKDSVADNGLAESVHFFGETSDPTLHHLYRDCSVFVMPSYFSALGCKSVTGEGFGIAYLEAAWAGKASIASMAGGHTDLIQDGFNGWLVDESPESLASLLRLLALNPHLVSSCGENALLTAQHSFSYEAFQVKLNNLLLSI